MTRIAFLLSAVSMLAGCESDAPIAREDAGSDSDAGVTRIDGGPSGFVCPTDVMTLVGTTCAAELEGERCAGACPPVPCFPCPLVVCTRGTWVVPPPVPDPLCDDAGPVDDVMCNVASEPVFPTFDRSCTTAADCTNATHQINCCGTLHEMGINVSERARFDAAETECRSEYPGCGCASTPTMADDGTDELTGPRPLRVECVAGQCATTYGLDDGEVCTGGGICGAGLTCCYPCGIAGCEDECTPTCDPGSPGCVDGCELRP